MASFHNLRIPYESSKKFDFSEPISQDEAMNQETYFYYFGYGYNLDPFNFRERLKDGAWLPDRLHKTGSLDGPVPVDLGTYVLPGHQFSYDLDLQGFREKGSVANVSPAPHHNVYGVVYRINAVQLKRLDRSEEVPRIYQRLLVKVHKEYAPQDVLEAWIDIGHSSAITKTPHPEAYYVDEIVKAATARGFPETYINHYLRFPGSG